MSIRAHPRRAHAVCPRGDVRDDVVVDEDSRVVDIEVVAASPDDDYRRHSQLQPEGAHAVDELRGPKGRSTRERPVEED